MYHETRPGFEALIEQVETDRDKPDSQFAKFRLAAAYKQYNSQSARCFTDEFIDDDDFEHVESLPKQMLTIESRQSLNINLASESINVINHLAAAFNDGLAAARRGNSSTEMLQNASRTTVASDIKAMVQYS